MWPFRRRPRIEIVADEHVPGQPWYVRIRNLPDLVEGGVFFVCGVGETRNEAANNAFKAAANAMFPPEPLEESLRAVGRIFTGPE